MFVKTSYDEKDVRVLLQDMTGQIEPMGSKERAEKMHAGVHYSELLPKEEVPTTEYLKLCDDVMASNAKRMARYVAAISEETISRHANPVLISLARAGTPIGVLMKRYIQQKYNINVPHYSISIIKDVGIDIAAMNHIYDNTVMTGDHSVADFVFVDGWSGKGAIWNQLNEAVDALHLSNVMWRDLKPTLCMIADPAKVADYCGTESDFLLPCAMLNCMISGLFSRSVIPHGFVNNGCYFHGSVYHEEFESIDRTYDFIESVEMYFPDITDISVIVRKPTRLPDTLLQTSWPAIVCEIAAEYLVKIGKVKPGLGECIRALVRRIPSHVLLNDRVKADDPDIAPIFQLCQEKNVPVVRRFLGDNYKVCAILEGHK